MAYIEEIAKDTKFIKAEDQLLVLIRRQVKTELMLEEKFRDLCEEVSNFVKESENVSCLRLTLEGFLFVTVNTKEYHSECSGKISRIMRRTLCYQMLFKAANFSHDTVCAYIASQSNGSQIKYDDINQIDEDDIEEMDIKWNMALLKNHDLVADKEAPTEFALMAKSSSENKVFDNSLCSKSCKKNTDSLNTKITELSEKLSDTKTNLYHYKLGLSQVEARLVEFKNQEIKFYEKIRGLEFKVESKDNRIERLTKKLEELKKEKEGLDSKLTVLFPPPAQVYYPPKKDMSWTGLPKFADDTINDYSRPSPSIESNSNDIQSRNSSVSENGESSSSISSKPVIKFVKAADSPTGNSQNVIDDKGYWDSGCSRHMTGNISYLSDYEPFDRGYVSFEGGGKITGKECIVLGRDFKLNDDTNVLLRTHRQHNMYSIDLNNIVPHKDLTCLVAKASTDESMLWHRRLEILQIFLFLVSDPDLLWNDIVLGIYNNPFGVMPKVLSQAWEKFFEIQHAQPEDTNELFQKLLEDLQIIREELSEYINSPSWNYPTFYNDDEEHSVQYKEYLENSSNAIAPVLPTKEPEYSLSMRYEHLNTTPETESDKIIKSSVKNLVPILSEYEVTSDNESECDMPVCEDSSTFDVCEDHSEILYESNNDITSNDDAFEDIEYVEAVVGGVPINFQKIQAQWTDNGTYRNYLILRSSMVDMLPSEMRDKKNSVLFTDTECLVLYPDFKLPDASQVMFRVPRENNMFNVNLKNIVPFGDLTCLFVKAKIDESNIWHRRLGHINFNTMKKLVKGNLVRGLLTKVFENDNTCVACKKGKQHRASYDYSRFTWVFFFATKDETSPILKTFITSLENQLSLKVKVIRSDNGTEFKNYDLNQFCRIKGIKREFSVPRTPQQNGIAERKNIPLIEAARTMVADSLLPIPFWAKAVNTACYVQSRVLVTKPHNKTPCELLHGKIPSIGFMRPFRCLVTILNTLDSIGKFDGRVDEGFLVGYSVSRKAFRVFNSRTRIVQETLHVNFLENKPNVAGFQDKFYSEKAGEESDQQYVLFPVWSFGSTNPQNIDGDAAFDGKEPEFDEKKPESKVNVSPSSSAQSKKKDDKTKREAKGKSPVESVTGYRNLSAEFEDYSDNNINEVNAAGTLVPTVGQISPNSTNTFSAAGPSNAAASPTHEKSSLIDASQLPDDPDMPELEDITYSDDEDDVGAEADFNNSATQTRGMTRVAKDQGGLF
nr:hypothetical protein [Tanacetum cinerariifolium]